MSFAEFEDILCVERTRFYSLQYDGAAELAPYPLVVNLGNEDAREARFAQTAAIMSCLDLMIAVDSGPAHLAGSLGVPTWLLLDYSNDPRWCFDRDWTPFYPAHRLFRARAAQMGDFAGMIYSVGGLLDGFVRKTLAYRGIVCD